VGVPDSYRVVEMRSGLTCLRLVGSYRSRNADTFALWCAIVVPGGVSRVSFVLRRYVQYSDSVRIWMCM